jgi:hypothetical protein
MHTTELACRVSLPPLPNHIILSEYSFLCNESHKDFYFSRNLSFPNILICWSIILSESLINRLHTYLNTKKLIELEPTISNTRKM